MNRWLFLTQRLTASLLFPLVLAHLVLMIIAVRHGLSAEAILSRTQGSLWWALFYCTFVIAVSLHAPLGLRNILIEWLSLPDKTANIVAFSVFLLLLYAGLIAVTAVI